MPGLGFMTSPMIGRKPRQNTPQALPAYSSKQIYPRILQDYIDHIQQFNEDGQLEFYPGSPWIALAQMRKKTACAFLNYTQVKLKSWPIILRNKIVQLHVK